MNGNICLRALARFNQKNGQLDSFFSYSGGGLRWFVVVCLHRLWLHTYRPKFWWWCVVVCGDVWWFWWFAVVCGGLRWFSVICGGLSFSHTPQSQMLHQLVQQIFFIESSSSWLPGFGSLGFPPSGSVLRSFLHPSLPPSFPPSLRPSLPSSLRPSLPQRRGGRVGKSVDRRPDSRWFDSHCGQLCASELWQFR